jgi:hypothetical protein
MKTKQILGLFVVVLGFELRVSHFSRKVLHTSATPPAPKQISKQGKLSGIKTSTMR